MKEIPTAASTVDQKAASTAVEKAGTRAD